MICNMNSMENIYNAIKENDSIVIFGHILPDGDCYGSEIAMREIIKDNFPNKKVYAIGTGIPSLFSLLSPTDEVSDETIKNSLAFLIDMNDLSRSQDKRISLANKFVKLDHHVESTPFDYPSYVDTESIASCQMVARFAFKYNLKLSNLAASCLFLGIVTDSGRFQYSPLTEELFNIVSKLMHYGANPKDIYSIIYQVDEKQLRYKGNMILNYKKSPHGVAYFYAPEVLYEKFDLTFEAISNQVNVLANIKGSPIWALFTEAPDGGIRVELRSTGYDVQKVACQFGGGGHVCASGARLSKENASQMDDIIKVCDEIIAKGELQ